MANNLIQLYADMAELTIGACERCRASNWENTCCSEDYCQLAIDTAKSVWGEDISHMLLDNGMFLDPQKGCLISPHFRPLCTIHHCEIESMGFFKDNLKLTEDYFKLRDQIDEQEWERIELAESGEENEV